MGVDQSVVVSRQQSRDNVVLRRAVLRGGADGLRAGRPGSPGVGARDLWGIRRSAKNKAKGAQVP